MIVRRLSSSSPTGRADPSGSGPPRRGRGWTSEPMCRSPTFPKDRKEQGPSPGSTACLRSSACSSEACFSSASGLGACSRAELVLPPRSHQRSTCGPLRCARVVQADRKAVQRQALRDTCDAAGAFSGTGDSPASIPRSRRATSGGLTFWANSRSAASAAPPDGDVPPASTRLRRSQYAAGVNGSRVACNVPRAGRTEQYEL